MVRLLLLTLCVASAVAELRKSLSFVPPNSHVDSLGQRQLQSFNHGGDAQVFKDFVRLTTDRQSKRGWVWSKAPIGLNTFSIVLDFRISGVGKHLFGDGLGLWVTDMRDRMAGSIHGFTHAFTGFGVIFDTFRNTEQVGAHKDVSVIWNDGKRSEDAVRAGQVGCDAPSMRYYEGRADFSPFNASRARITWAHHQVTVDIDPIADGNWVQCAVLLDHHIPADVFARAHVGVLATTGQLADNHDVLSLRVFDDVDEASQVCSAAPELPTGSEFAAASLEHRLTGIVESLTNTVGKLKAAEAEDRLRVEALEARVAASASEVLEARLSTVEQSMKSFLTSHIEDRLAAVEGAVDAKLHAGLVSRLGHLERQFSESIDVRLRNLEASLDATLRSEVAASGGQWKIPFGIIATIVVCFFIWAFKWNRWLKSMHTL